MAVAGYMVAPGGQVADVAAAITGFLADDMAEGWEYPVAQFPYGWSPSEVFYNVPELGDTNIRCVLLRWQRLVAPGAALLAGVP